MSYSIAVDVKECADHLIAQYHPHLAGVRIGYLFREKAGMKGGRLVAGQASKFPKKLAPLFRNFSLEMGEEDPEDYVFLIEVAWDLWKEMSEREQWALVDHELCHCSVEEKEDGNIKYSIVGHDYEEFHSVIERHGIYNGEMESLKSLLDKED